MLWFSNLFEKKRIVRVGKGGEKERNKKENGERVRTRGGRGRGLSRGVKNTLAHKNAVCQVAHRTRKGLQIFILY